MKWKKLDNERKYYISKGGFYVIKPNSSKKPIPFECPLCKLLMNNAEDPHYYNEFECCEDCGIKWAEPNREKWKTGWRPSKEELVYKKRSKFLKLNL